MEKAVTKTTMKEIIKNMRTIGKRKETEWKMWEKRKNEKKGGKGKKRRKMYKECRSTFASLGGPPILDCSLDLC